MYTAAGSSCSNLPAVTGAWHKTTSNPLKTHHEEDVVTILDQLKRNTFDILRLQETLRLSELRISSLEGQLSGLTISPSTRTWYLSNYKLCIGKADDYDREILSADDVIVPLGADAVADAALFKGGERNDVCYYERLYGIDPLRVLEISKSSAGYSCTIINTVVIALQKTRLSSQP